MTNSDKDDSKELATPLDDNDSDMDPERPTLISAMVPILKLGLPVIVNFFFVRAADIAMLHFLANSATFIHCWRGHRQRLGPHGHGIAGVWLRLCNRHVGVTEFREEGLQMCGVYYNRGCVFSLIASVILLPWPTSQASSCGSSASPI